MKSVSKKSLVNFGLNLRRLRVEGGYTQEALAEKLDLNARHYQKLEAGTVSPTFGVLIRLHRTFKCSWNELFENVS